MTSPGNVKDDARVHAAPSAPRRLSLSAIVVWTSGGVAQLVERLHGMQEVREFDSPRLHQKAQLRGGAWGQATSVLSRAALRILLTALFRACPASSEAHKGSLGGHTSPSREAPGTSDGSLSTADKSRTSSWSTRPGCHRQCSPLQLLEWRLACRPKGGTRRRRCASRDGPRHG